MPLEYLTRIAQTPAPTFDEARRADLITSLWEGLGYPCQRDEVGNVMTRIEPGGAAGQPALAVMAHLDTVFSLETDVTVRQERDRYTGPGVGDNSASLAAVTAFLRDLRGHTAQLTRPLWVVANVGEEGLGDLRGAKHFIAENRAGLGALLAVDSSYVAVQGPPGTGKTYSGSRVIKRLVEDHGWRVGVVAQSHAVVENMLSGVIKAGLDPDNLPTSDPSAMFLVARDWLG